MIRRLIGASLFVGLGTGLVVGALLAALPAVRITGGADAIGRPTMVRAVLIEDLPGAAPPAAPEAWRRCPYLVAVAARSGCPFLAARAAGSGCPYIEGLRRGTGRCPALPPSVEPAPRLHPEGAVRAAFAAPATVAPAASPT